MRVAIQGQEASYHHIAAKKYFGANVSTLDCKAFKDVFKAVEKGDAEYGLIAIENSLYGAINAVYDLLLKKEVWVSGEVYLRIEHCLIGLPKAIKSNLKEIYSHEVALGQCLNYLEHNYAQAKHIAYHDTVASVVLVKEKGDTTRAAIASSDAAELHNMKILESNIEDNKQNFTRFVVIQKQQSTNKLANKTSLIIKTAHTPGALYNALGCFKQFEINISKLQSRPIVGKAWQYMFYIDAETGVNTKEYKMAHKMLEKQGCEVVILGSYVAAR